jgi:hypothetical protein
MMRRHEQLSQKPHVATDPAPGETEDPIVLLRHPQTVGIVPQGKRLKPGRGGNGHRAKTMPFREIVDAGHHEGIGKF